MDITTLGFLLFITCGLLIYYSLPHKIKWIFLLVISGIFYSIADIRNILFILLLTSSSFFFGKAIEKKTSQTMTGDGGGGGQQKLPKFLVTVAIIFDLLVLVLIKYLPDTLKLNNTVQQEWHFLRFFMPIGISYYTLMSISYVLDVYWKKCKAEHNFFKLMLFISYFPLLLQGPISRWPQLSEELFKEHNFNWKNVKFGVQLMLYGYFKKLVIANRAMMYTSKIFWNDSEQYGLNVLIGLILYGIELYCDFSGGIDIVRGVSECFGINLIENFSQPFFSRSLGEFWRRWHISLGAWMKDYVFIPFSMSPTISKLKKFLKNHCSKKTANRIPIALADLLVFALVGLWHGTGSIYFGWGIYNGVILAFSVLMTDVYEKQKAKLHINSQSKIWNGFCIFRTFVIVTIGWVFDCSRTAKESLIVFLNMFRFSQTNLSKMQLGSKLWLCVFVLSCLAVFVISIFNERKISIREKLSKKPFIIQMLFWVCVIQYIILFHANSDFGGFLYANF